MPRTVDARVDSYLKTLERALLDGVLAEHEKNELVDVAAALGLSRGAVLELHAGDLEAMAEVALDDGIVTDQERANLDEMAAVLGLRRIDLERALANVTARRADAAPAGDDGHTADLRLGTAGAALQPGDRIVFTGVIARERTAWEGLACSLGYVPGGVTKTTKLVVASGPNSQSGKAAKARSCGIPIITEQAFARMVGP
ncbi:hypothetical protein [Brachybacterium hainanense]